MSKKIKRLMALLLSAMMLLSLAACSQSGSGSGSGNSELSEIDKIDDIPFFS